MRSVRLHRPWSFEVTQSAINPHWLTQLATLLDMDPNSPSLRKFLDRISSGYLEQYSPDDAAFDYQQVTLIEAANSRSGRLTDESGLPGVSVTILANPDSAHRLVFAPIKTNVPGTIRLKRFGFKGAELSRLVHVLDSFGFAVVEDVPSQFAADGDMGRAIHLDDLELRWSSQEEVPLAFDLADDGQRIADALAAVDMNLSEIDLLNRLTVSAKLPWRQISLLRAYRRYRLQLSAAFPEEQLDQVLFQFPLITSALIAHFDAKFNPIISPRDEALERSRVRANELLQSVSSFADDQILRGFLELIDDTVRTNVFSGRSLLDASSTIVLKFAPSPKSSLLPHSMFETFVVGMDVVGIHLRANKIARGGIRWSDRMDDFRTEIYDLALAQVKKNAVIVPTGAKGGFVVNNSTSPSQQQIRNAYRTFISSLLDITDNVVDGSTVTPEGIVAYDGDDHYLVVAADKGTGSFSDLANEVSLEHGYWLGDAFASGGSNGYDHKELAITARGAWIAVRRHFRNLGIDIATEPCRVVGVGDMSGDIFGNGMLQSDQIKLLAAFDHRHIFMDPDPEPSSSFAERSRIASLSASSWADYDQEKISIGGGVWPRSSKQIPLSPQASDALGLQQKSATPLELISAILAAPADLIWFGGIGTYVKDKDESDEDVSDSANDAVRISADKIRARVIAEGANLAVSQRGRIRYSRRGGRIDTDFIDNAGGVAMSDYEVNLKILLDLAIAEGALDKEERNRLLVAVTSEAVRKVLTQVENEIVALDRGLEATSQHLDACEALIESWEASNHFDRVIDFLPDEEEFSKRRTAQAGLTRPELAVLQSYAISFLASSLKSDSQIVGPALIQIAHDYFPPSISVRFASLMRKHPLYNDLVATNLATELINRMGVVWAHEIAEELDLGPNDVAKAFWIACEVSGATRLWKDLDALSAEVNEDDILTVHKQIVSIVDSVARAYIARIQEVDNLEILTKDDIESISSFNSNQNNLDELASRFDDALAGRIAGTFPEEFTRKLRSVAMTPGIVEAIHTARIEGAKPETVSRILVEIDRRSHISEIIQLMNSVHVENRWTAWQISGLKADLREWRRNECRALISPSTKTGPTEAFDTWESTRARNFAKIVSLIDAASKNKGDRLTLTSLAIRELMVATSPSLNLAQE